MIILVRKLREWFKFMLLFFLLTMFFYHVVHFFEPYFNPNSKYREPHGGAVKVMTKIDMKQSVLDQIKDRLYLFFWLGE